eukprot:TRINITY_DN9906_c4_g1_i1.p3 TRINITY_DN9906_c4_g1~~TRINITY_DN9906_c4_g1_i1.p3  ORF type:complete len:104 (-),score=13.75 TRINITY_DN9906_c4_g1_i1:130-441(-)
MIANALAQAQIQFDQNQKQNLMDLDLKHQEELEDIRKEGGVFKEQLLTLIVEKEKLQEILQTTQQKLTDQAKNNPKVLFYEHPCQQTKFQAKLIFRSCEVGFN